MVSPSQWHLHPSQWQVWHLPLTVTCHCSPVFRILSDKKQNCQTSFHSCLTKLPDKRTVCQTRAPSVIWQNVICGEKHFVYAVINIPTKPTPLWSASSPPSNEPSPISLESLLAKLAYFSMSYIFSSWPTVSQLQNLTYINKPIWLMMDCPHIFDTPSLHCGYFCLPTWIFIFSTIPLAHSVFWWRGGGAIMYTAFAKRLHFCIIYSWIVTNPYFFYIH